MKQTNDKLDNKLEDLTGEVKDLTEKVDKNDAKAKEAQERMEGRLNRIEIEMRRSQELKQGRERLIRKEEDRNKEKEAEEKKEEEMLKRKKYARRSISIEDLVTEEDHEEPVIRSQRSRILDLPGLSIWKKNWQKQLVTSRREERRLTRGQDRKIERIGRTEEYTAEKKRNSYCLRRRRRVRNRREEQKGSLRIGSQTRLTRKILKNPVMTMTMERNGMKSRGRRRTGRSSN